MGIQSEDCVIMDLGREQVMYNYSCISNRTPKARQVLAVMGICALLVSGALGVDVSRRTVNSDQLILENVPPIPDSLVDELNRYQNVRGAVFRDWTPEGGVLIGTRFADTVQLHRVDRAEGARRQLTFFREPVGDAICSPVGGPVCFLMDAGGKENSQLYLYYPASGEHTLLTDGQSRNSAPLWSPDGQRLAYSSTQRNGRSNDVCLLRLDEPTARAPVYMAPDGAWWGPADWSRDGARLLVQQYISVNDSRIHQLDLPSKELQLIAGGGERPSRNAAPVSATFSDTESGIFLITDQQSEFAQLAYMPLPTGPSDRTTSTAALQVITGDIPWDVEQFALSSDRRRGAFSVNAGGQSRLYLFDPSAQKYVEVPQVPTGIIGGLAFRPNGRQLAMTISTPRTSSDVYVLDLTDNRLEPGALVRWTFSEVGGLNTDTFSVPELIHYPTFDEIDGERRQIPAYVYRPRKTGPFPVVIYVHGGPEGQFRPGFFSLFQTWIDKVGVAVIAPNVRGSTGYGRNYVNLDNGRLREDSVKDIGALLDWIATQPDLDAKRVAIYGGSYGGYMVLASAVHYSHRLRAAVDVVGISNFVTFLENTEDYRRDLRRVEYGDERDPQMREFLRQISPFHHVDKIQIPLLVIQGQNDPRVPVSEAAQIVAALREHDRDVWYVNGLNEGHGFQKKENRDVSEQVTVLFLRKFLTP